MEWPEIIQAYEMYVAAHAGYTGRSRRDIRLETNEDEFLEKLCRLHYQWMCGEFSFGKFTEISGIPHLELWEILDALGLQIHR